MTEEQFIDLMRGDDLCDKFENIPVQDRLNPDRKVCGILKVQSLLKEPEKMWL